MRRAILSLPFLSLALAAGCQSGASPEPESSDAATTEALIEGSPEAVGVLRFLNDASTTETVLDDEVPLPSHAAHNLVVHRNGPDGQHGTSDDDLYDDLNEVLAVPQIGPSRLAAIADFGAHQGFTPTGDDLLGTYDGVAFTVNEAVATLQLVNGASETELDVDIALDKRAVDSILAARPIATVLQLSELYYVGGSALAKLKAWAATGTLAAVGEDCANNADCLEGLRCEGKPFDGSPEIGKCIPQGNVPGADDECQADSDCLEGLACAGLTVYGGTGFCRPTWMFGTFASEEASIPIPDADQAGVSMDLVVYGLATVPEDLMVTIDLDHPRPQDLVVRLVSTNGSDSLLWNHDQSPAFYLSATGIERDNYINGQLTLEVMDTVSGETGVLHGFEVWVSSRYD
ncbi:MAG: proprotein convertase P-domain-containing protein [Myxococcales bacterium]|nr:proprotein convertase P-domain-containing protein [Myxococcales bacterium]